mmetsp:Transcript_11545/g.35099  ORF Transcript_11545/g.35099 Transcript_11545/m.35099 type:complete len:362 (-) Transcript_11545:152-1237(-)
MLPRALRVVPVALRHDLLVGAVRGRHVIQGLVGLNRRDVGVGVDVLGLGADGGHRLLSEGLDRLPLGAGAARAAKAAPAVVRQALPAVGPLHLPTLPREPVRDLLGLWDVVLALLVARGVDHDVAPRHRGQGDAVVVVHPNPLQGDEGLLRLELVQLVPRLGRQVLPQGDRHALPALVEDGEVPPGELPSVGLPLDAAHRGDLAHHAHHVQQDLAPEVLGKVSDLGHVQLWPGVGHLLCARVLALLDLRPVGDQQLVVVLHRGVRLVRGLKSGAGHIVHLPLLDTLKVLLGDLPPKRGLDPRTVLVDELNVEKVAVPPRALVRAHGALARDAGSNRPRRPHVRVQALNRLDPPSTHHSRRL